jgi:ribosome-binding factor A
VNELRLKKVESLIRELVSTLIINDQVKDPRVSTLLSITKAEAAKDISTCRLYVSSIESDKSLEESVKALNHAAGFIQKAISPRLRMRVTPRLKFYVDRSLKDGFEINQKIDEMQNRKDQQE